MKIPPRLLFASVILFFAVNILTAQCPNVVDNSFAADPINIDGTCVWTLTFDVENVTGDGDEGLVFSIFVLHPDNTKTEIDVGNDFCFPKMVPASDFTHTESYTGSCLVDFELSWKSYLVNDCGVDPCNQGFQTTVSPAPVELVEFTGTAKAGTVELNWVTESEENNRHFEIQRSEDGFNFENIGSVLGQGTFEAVTEYQFVDKRALPFAYYRLKQVDFDGKYNFSNIIGIRRGDFESKLLVYPTQAFNEVTIRIETLDSRKSYLKIANISGQVVFETTYFGANDAEYMTMDVHDYPPGIYFVSLTNKVETVSGKFVVAKD